MFEYELDVKHYSVLQLEQEIESNPPELMEELEEEFVKLQTAVNDLEKENEKIKTTYVLI